MPTKKLWMQTFENYNLHFPVPTLWQFLAGAVSAAWLATPSVWRVLIALICFDFCTGMIAAVYQHRFHLSTAWWGLVRKGLTVWLLLNVQVLATIANVPADVSGVLVMTFAFYELCSGARNCGRVGVAIQPLVSVMAKLKAAIASGEVSETKKGKRK